MLRTLRISDRGTGYTLTPILALGHLWIYRHYVLHLGVASANILSFNSLNSTGLPKFADQLTL
jgi:hypothetical protein